MTLCVQPLPYHSDSATLFHGLAAHPWSVWLDSGRPGCPAGRWDILSCRPRVRLITRGAVTEIRGGATRRFSRADPLDLLRRQLGPLQPRHPELPFCGGALGWFGYDLGRRFESLPASARDDQRLPEMAVGLYDWVLLVDHERRRAWLAGQEGRSPRARALLEQVARREAAAAPGPFAVRGAVHSNLSDRDYADRFDRVQAYLQAGDCYQVNLTRRFAVAAEGDPWRAYLELRRRNPAPFGAYLHTPPLHILSASPERFLRLRGTMAETCPIKGTIRRLAEPEADFRQRQRLRASAKDQAENLMIVDLLRNDFGRVCVPGSIRVPELFALQSFADVHHLVSRIRGQLAPGLDALALLRACFPGGSVTGAPKIRAMQIIEELEGERRALYCGAIGYLSFAGDLDTSIAIRTLTYARNQLRYWAGGGIVADSGHDAEAAELALKALALREVAEFFRRDAPPAPEGLW